MVDMAGVLNEHKQILESDDDVEEEKLQEMIDWYGTVDEWVAQVKEEISKSPCFRDRRSHPAHLSQNVPFPPPHI